MPVSKDKVVGMFLGGFIGDTMGKPVETWEPDKIQQNYGRLITIESPSKHKWFKGQLGGTWSDDTQLRIAVAQAMLDVDSFEDIDVAMNAQVIRHIKAREISMDGWGGSTRDAVERLSNGVHWSESGQSSSVMRKGKPTGGGNGVAMKIDPLGAYLALKGKDVFSEVIDFLMALNEMTHQSVVSACASAAMVMAIRDCLLTTPEKLKNNLPNFIEDLKDASTLIENLTDVDDKGILGDNVTLKLMSLYNYQEYDTKKIISDFGGGSCYVYNSVPFTLMFFVQNPLSIDALYDVINAGGDTDSNGSMLGAMLGALHGPDIFPRHLVDALDSDQLSIVLETATKFYDKFKG